MVVGDIDAGKSSLIHRYIYGEFIEKEPTVAIEFDSLEIKNRKLQFWNASGNGLFDYVSKSNITNAPIVVIAFDCTKNNSILSVLKWYNAAKCAKCSDTTLFIICATKSEDEHDFLTNEQKEDLLSIFSHPVHYIETSAKTGRGIRSIIPDYVFHKDVVEVKSKTYFDSLYAVVSKFTNNKK